MVIVQLGSTDPWLRSSSHLPSRRLLHSVAILQLQGKSNLNFLHKWFPSSSSFSIYLEIMFAFESITWRTGRIGLSLVGLRNWPEGWGEKLDCEVIQHTKSKSDVLVTFLIPVSKFQMRSSSRGKGLLWLIVQAHSPQWWGRCDCRILRHLSYCFWFQEVERNSCGCFAHFFFFIQSRRPTVHGPVLPTFRVVFVCHSTQFRDSLTDMSRGLSPR